MVSSSENSKSPFRGSECLRPLERGERCVAVATDLLYRAVRSTVVQADTQRVSGKSNARKLRFVLLGGASRMKPKIWVAEALKRK